MKKYILQAAGIFAALSIAGCGVSSKPGEDTDSVSRQTYENPESMSSTFGPTPDNDTPYMDNIVTFSDGLEVTVGNPGFGIRSDEAESGCLGIEDTVEIVSVHLENTSDRPIDMSGRDEVWAEYRTSRGIVVEAKRYLGLLSDEEINPLVEEIYIEVEPLFKEFYGDPTPYLEEDAMPEVIYPGDTEVVLYGFCGDLVHEDKLAVTLEGYAGESVTWHEKPARVLEFD